MVDHNPEQVTELATAAQPPAGAADRPSGCRQASTSAGSWIRNRGGSIVRLVRRLLPLATLALLAACGNIDHPAAGATTAPTPGVYSPGPGVVVHSDPPSPSPAALTWKNCDPAKSGVLDYKHEGCSTSYLTEPCQASKYSEFQGDLLEAYIENKDEIDEAALHDCPQYLPTWQKAKRGFTDGTHLVPEDVQPGTYQTTAGVTDCYWERNRGGQILANNFITGARSTKVTVQKGDETLVTRGCGDWVPV